MQITYHIPKHLEGFLADMPEPSITKMLTIMLELAVRHDLIHYPDSFVERFVKEMRTDLKEIKTLIKTNSGTDEVVLKEILNTVQQIALQKPQILYTAAPAGVRVEDATLDLSKMQALEAEEDSGEIDVWALLDDIGRDGVGENV
jgi:hypothetical protein